MKTFLFFIGRVDESAAICRFLVVVLVAKLAGCAILIVVHGPIIGDIQIRVGSADVGSIATILVDVDLVGLRIIFFLRVRELRIPLRLHRIYAY